MSTKIEDLPGSQQVVQQLPPSPAQQLTPEISNVQMDIKKKVRFKDENEVYEIKENEPPAKIGLFSRIKSEFNEENLLLLAVLFIASTSYIDGYLNLVPFVGQYASIPGSTLFSIVKCIMLFALFIVLKLFLLPYVQL
jgi:hypothetical protein